jgi:hypothetical protein
VHEGVWYYDAKFNSPFYRKFLREWQDSINELVNL